MQIQAASQRMLPSLLPADSCIQADAVGVLLAGGSIAVKAAKAVHGLETGDAVGCRRGRVWELRDESG